MSNLSCLRCATNLTQEIIVEDKNGNRYCVPCSYILFPNVYKEAEMEQPHVTDEWAIDKQRAICAELSTILAQAEAYIENGKVYGQLQELFQRECEKLVELCIEALPSDKPMISSLLGND